MNDNRCSVIYRRWTIWLGVFSFVMLVAIAGAATTLANRMQDFQAADSLRAIALSAEIERARQDGAALQDRFDRLDAQIANLPEIVYIDTIFRIRPVRVVFRDTVVLTRVDTLIARDTLILAQTDTLWLAQPTPHSFWAPQESDWAWIAAAAVISSAASFWVWNVRDSPNGYELPREP